MTEALNTKLQKILDADIASGNHAGACISVFLHGKEIACVHSGYADIEAKKPFERDTIIRLYSMSKPITACAVMILFDRGLLDPSTPLSACLPEFENTLVREGDKLVPMNKAIRIADLLDMTAGFSYGAPDSPETEAVFTEIKERLDTEQSLTTREVASMLAKCPLSFQPRDSWQYSSCADILGAVVEAVSGKPFHQFLQDELFTPLNMTDTGFYVPEEKQNRLAKVYETTPEGLKLFTGCHLGISNSMKKAPAFESGGAGLCSTIEDYSHFASMLLQGGTYEGKQILSPKMVTYFTSAELLPWQQEAMNRSWDSLDGYTYGNLLRVMIRPSQADTLSTTGEYGWDGWLGAYFVNSPKDDVTVLLTMQHTNSGTTPVARRLKNAIWSAL